MPKGPCDKRKRTNDPKCTDKPIVTGIQRLLSKRNNL